MFNSPCSILHKTLSAALIVVLGLFVSGCVTPDNSCGNEDRDWNNLHFPKSRYCSIPAFLPFSDYYEAANKAVCKVHDNNSGKRATMPRSEADKRFLCDYMKHSELPTLVRMISGHTSYLMLRIGAPYEALTTHGASRIPLKTGNGQPVKNMDGKPVLTEQN